MFVQLLQGLGTASACGILGPSGVVLNPLLGTLASWAGKSVEAEYGKLADGVGGVLSNVLSILATNDAQKLRDRVRRGEGNGDLVRAAAAAIRSGLQYARKQLQSEHPALMARDLDPWFLIWEARLLRAKNNKDEAALFLTGSGQSPAAIHPDKWWPQFEPVLLRWGQEQAKFEGWDPAHISSIPELIRVHFAKHLPRHVYEAFEWVVRDDENKRAWITWQQRFLEHIAAETRTSNSEVSRCFTDLSKSIDQLVPYLGQRVGDGQAKPDRIEKRLEPEIPLATASQMRRSAQPRGSTIGPASDLTLLSPFADIVPHQGRESDLQRMLQWLDSGPSISIRTLIGRAGAGKTRFAVELLKRLEARSADAWHAGFLSPTDLRGAKADGILNRSRPSLIIIDYASAVLPDLREWLESVADNDDSSNPLRILLLDRGASARQGWLNTLQMNSKLRAFFDDPEPIPLRPIDGSAQRRIILKHTLQAAASRRGAPCPALPPDGNTEFEKRLNLPIFNEPLYLQMAALLALDGIVTILDLLLLSRTELAEGLARTEAERIRRFCRDRNSAGERLLLHMAAYSTLVGGIALGKLTEIILSEAEVLQNRYDPSLCAMELLKALPEGEPVHGVAPIVPDIVGEAFVVQICSGVNRALSDELILRLGLAAVPTIIRIAQDFAFEGELQQNTTERHLSIEWLDQLIDTKDPVLLKGIVLEIPDQGVSLRESRVKLLETRRELLRQAESADWKELALINHDLGSYLGEIRRTEEALKAAEEAATYFRKLSADEPDTFLPYLAASLDCVSARRSETGAQQKALEAAEEALSIYRGLFADKGSLFLADLARSLLSVAGLRSDMGRLAEALEPGEEALLHFRKLAAERQDVFLHFLLLSLDDVGLKRAEQGKRKEALEATEEGVVIRRKLAAERPDVFLPELILSLNNVSLVKSNLGDKHGALEAAEEALMYSRQLSGEKLEAFVSDLAKSLNHVGKMRVAVGKHVEALEASEEALTIRRKLASRKPDAALANLSTSLATVAADRRRVGKKEEALEAAEEVVTLYRTLAADQPDPFSFQLANALSTMAVIRGELNKPSLQLAEESVSILRKLAADAPNTYIPHLARALYVLSTAHFSNTQTERCLYRSREALRILSPVYLKHPTAFHDLMLSILHLYTKVCKVEQTSPDKDLIAPILDRIKKAKPS